MNNKIGIIPPTGEFQLQDKVQWEKLFKGYADFYKEEINDKILQTVWN